VRNNGAIWWRVVGGLLSTTGLVAVTVALVERIDYAERWLLIGRNARQRGLVFVGVLVGLFAGYGVLNVLHLTTRWGKKTRGPTRQLGCVLAVLGVLGWLWVGFWLFAVCID